MMSNTETATAEKPKYAPLPEEDGAAYANRLKSTPATNRVALAAANIVARAMTLGLYRPEDFDGTDKSSEEFGAAIHTITEALRSFDALHTTLVGNPKDIHEVALNATRRAAEKQLKGIPGSTRVPYNVRQRLVARVTSGAEAALGQAADILIVKQLSPALAETWSQLKALEGLTDDNVPASKVIAAFKEDGKPTPASQLVGEISELRNTCRKKTEALRR